MLTAIILLSVIGIVLEFLGWLDLFSTLQNNYVGLGIAVFLTSFIGFNEIWFAVDFDGTLLQREIVYGIVSLDVTIAALIMLYFKPRLQKMLKRKRISKGMIEYHKRKNTGGTNEKETKNTETNAGNKASGKGSQDSLHSDVSVRELRNGPDKSGD